MILPLSITVLRRCAIVITVQLMNASLRDHDKGSETITGKSSKGLTECRPDSLLDKSIGVEVNCCSCLVQNQNLGLPQQRPGGKVR